MAVPCKAPRTLRLPSSGLLTGRTLDGVLGEASRRQASLRTAVAGGRITELWKPLPSHGATVWFARMGGRDVVVRHKSCEAEALLALRHHVAVYRAAHDMGSGHLVHPAVRVRLPERAGGYPAGTKLMVTEHAGSSFETGDKVPDHILARVSPGDRLAAAVLAVLFLNKDQGLGNVLVGRRGELRLIDLDNTLGFPFGWPGWKPVFFPGQPLAFPAKRGTFRSLPAQIRSVISRWMSLDAGALASRYGLTVPEARTLGHNAGLIRVYGLSGATQRLRWWEVDRGGPAVPLHPRRRIGGLPDFMGGLMNELAAGIGSVRAVFFSSLWLIRRRSWHRRSK